MSIPEMWHWNTKWPNAVEKNDLIELLDVVSTNLQFVKKKKEEEAIYVRDNKAKLNKQCVLVNDKAEIQVQAI